MYLILAKFKEHMQGKIVCATQQLGTQIEYIPLEYNHDSFGSLLAGRDF